MPIRLPCCLVLLDVVSKLLLLHHHIHQPRTGRTKHFDWLINLIKAIWLVDKWLINWHMYCLLLHNPLYCCIKGIVVQPGMQVIWIGWELWLTYPTYTGHAGKEEKIISESWSQQLNTVCQVIDNICCKSGNKIILWFLYSYINSSTSTWFFINYLHFFAWQSNSVLKNREQFNQLSDILSLWQVKLSGVRESKIIK